MGFMNLLVSEILSLLIDEFRFKKRNGFVKPMTVSYGTPKKVFVFSRQASLRHLEMDLRKLMLPHTALKLKEKKRNNLKDFLNVAGPMASDIAKSQVRPRCPPDLFKTPPLILLSGFGTGEQQLKLTTIMFQNIFPAIDINTVKLSTCQRIVLNYNKETGSLISGIIQSDCSLLDVSDFVTKAGYGSESEADDEAATVNIASDMGRVNRSSNKSAVRLQEIGPRMTLQLVKVEEGLSAGGVIFSEYGNISKKEHQKGSDKEDKMEEEEEVGEQDGEEMEDEEGTSED
ncbi:hypothetical protein Leryth_011186 [Lithospermum erythrorhizon]|nr:hypothetical protein Leryth_011186 [Lithospermum erythrorhizon]